MISVALAGSAQATDAFYGVMECSEDIELIPVPDPESLRRSATISTAYCSEINHEGDRHKPVSIYELPASWTLSSPEIQQTPMFKRWFRNVFKLGPKWDTDSWIFNYIMHPYAGAVYFMSARSSGFNYWGSLLYCTCISSIFWEFGRPKRRLVADDFRICGSPVLGGVVAFLIDPVNEVLGLFTGNPARAEAARQRGLRSSIMPATVAGAPGFTFSCTF